MDLLNRIIDSYKEASFETDKELRELKKIGYYPKTLWDWVDFSISSPGSYIKRAQLIEENNRNQPQTADDVRLVSLP